ncbi:MAG: hypothetical protein JJ858_16375 [Rhizobiaceae bacterium]|nr:hypothetical protein [Rhizobiaceae bacterium]
MPDPRNWHQFTSTQLAAFIFNNYKFNHETIVDVYTTIVKNTAYNANDSRSGREAVENLKELMKYRFLDRLFGKSEEGKMSVAAVYHRLSSVKRIRQNDQFYLQYAMAAIDGGKLDDAETFLNTALSIAKSKGTEYSPHQILDQRARLYLRKNSQHNHHISKKELSTAQRDLMSALSDSKHPMIYPLRSGPLILKLVDEKIEEMGEELRKGYLDLVILMRERESRVTDNRHFRRGEQKQLVKDIKLAQLCLENY